MKHLIPRLLRLVTGLLLLPACAAVTMTLLETLRCVGDNSVLMSPQTLWLCGGFFLWLAVWFLLPQPIQAYVMAHELTHALWGLLFGARVRDFNVSARGGSVRVSRSNLLITLAPYFFPFYTVAVILLRVLLGLFIMPVPYPLLWLFLVGLTWGFHVCFTVQSLMIRQPDIQEHGRIFSWVLIYLFNLVGVGLWVVCTTKAVAGDFVIALAANTAASYAFILTFIARLLK
ncbi:MAG: hypothetical protein PHU80_07055 [Kiritimatiellae bacterium]|nr:hypothetical protein [Kiritimatiellia bacterium]